MDKSILGRITARAEVKDQYQKQLARVKASNQETAMIKDAVDEVMKKLPTASPASLVIYGDPQSGKTEMMICLTGALLDSGIKTVIHLMNDSVDLLVQSLDRFKLAGLAPAPRNAHDLISSPLVKGHNAIIFCKKNAKDLRNLINQVKHVGPLVVVDDEADYATPNGKINQNQKTKINELVAQLLGKDGKYIGVTATPARLNLNNTFNTSTETWVQFKPHSQYTGQDTFFPLSPPLKFRLNLLPGQATPTEAKKALARFLLTVAYLNTAASKQGKAEENYSFLVHTSGKTADHKKDRRTIEAAMGSLVDGKSAEYEAMVELIYKQAEVLYPKSNAEELTEYVVGNASRHAFVVLNSQRDRSTAGDKPTVPTCPFTVIIGGNIVSRGVTFPNLLSMYFTRDVKTKLQQDTYIQRARMFGARGKYLTHFELTIPNSLYEDWHRCFVFHRLALQAIKNNKSSPVWVGDTRISIAAASSIDRGTVDLNRGEMGFQTFSCSTSTLQKLDSLVKQAPTEIKTLEEMQKEIGPSMPPFLINFLRSSLRQRPGSLAIHTSTSIANQSSADKDAISRTKGFMGNPQLEKTRFPDAIHHVKIFHNEKGKARVFYKNLGGVKFVQNVKK